ncbi:MAG: MerR family transcriptional regulator [Arenicellales bacterium]
MLDPGAEDLPPIPGKRYFTIGEVGQLCSVKPHVLRYWEQEFPQLQPVKRRGNRRYYQRHEVELIRTIRKLLYIEGYTISGACNQLSAASAETADLAGSNSRLSDQDVDDLVVELEEIAQLLRA